MKIVLLIRVPDPSSPIRFHAIGNPDEKKHEKDETRGTLGAGTFVPSNELVVVSFEIGNRFAISRTPS